MTGRMMMALETAIEKESPRCVMVYGDTNSTLAGAIVAAKMNIPVAHVEAGLRSYNKRMPEEINRLVTDQLSGLLLCPTKASVLNLDREGITKGVHHVGDVMYDATLKVTEISLRRSDIHEKLGVTQGEYAVATLHRAENTDDPAKLTKFLSLLKEEARDCPIVFPVHPRTRKAIDRLNLDLNGLLACSPVGYIDMARLLNGARRVFTDSGGIQKEAYFHRVPCVTLRDETEWTETVDAGWNRLWNVDEYKPRREIDDYGEGDSSEKIVRLLAEFVT